MFERRLKKNPSGPEPLDLKRHKPSEFSGKTVSLDGRDYLIGGRFKESDQGYAHRLTNQLSGLCQHVIQIRREYMDAPETALSASCIKVEETARLRAGMRSAGNSVEIAPLTVRHAHGGSFELHETSWGMVGHDTEPPAVEAINEAVSLMERGEHEAAMSGLERILATYPNHTAALVNLAGCYAALGDQVKALAMCDRAVGIEPNLSLYRGYQIINAVNCPRRYRASTLFDDFQLRYPLLRDYDYYGIHAYLRTGQAPKADETLQRASALKPNEVNELRLAVEAAMRAHQRFAALGQRVRQSGAEMCANEEMLSVLNGLHADCAVDPFIQANLGLALARAGEHRRAAELLLSAAGGISDALVPHCWANAAYSFIASGDWKSAMALLDTTMVTLKRVTNGPVDPIDVPGLATWIDETGARESITPNAADVVERALAQCPDASLVTPAIRDMSTLLRQFQSRVSSGEH